MRILACTILAAAVSTALSGSAQAAPPKCGAAVNFDAVDTICEFSPEEGKRRLRAPGNRPAGPYEQTRHVLYCTHDRALDDDGEACTPCENPESDRYTLQRRTVQPDGSASPWQVFGQVCLTPADIDEIANPDITPGMVLVEFRRLTWPEADLVIQPVGGETLVNIPTVFHVTNAQPTTQTVTLLGQTVQVEATPTSWTWHWATRSDDRTHADDTEARTTTYPGTPYPDASVAHEYRRTGTVHPSVDVTYTGRYRVNDGPWTDLPDTHTVTGQAQTLDVLEARPTLVR